MDDLIKMAVAIFTQQNLTFMISKHCGLITNALCCVSDFSLVQLL